MISSDDTPTQFRAETAEPLQVTASALWDLIPDGLLAVSTEGRITAANTAAATIFEADVDQLIGLTIEALVDPGSRRSHSELRSRWQSEAHVRAMSPERVFAARTLGGRPMKVRIALSPIHPPRPTVVIAVVRPVEAEHPRRGRPSHQDDLAQHLFGMSMSLRSVVSAIEDPGAIETLERIVTQMGSVADTLATDDDARDEHEPTDANDDPAEHEPTEENDDDARDEHPTEPDDDARDEHSTEPDDDAPEHDTAGHTPREPQG